MSFYKQFGRSIVDLLSNKYICWELRNCDVICGSFKEFLELNWKSYLYLHIYNYIIHTYTLYIVHFLILFYMIYITYVCVTIVITLCRTCIKHSLFEIVSSKIRWSTDVGRYSWVRWVVCSGEACVLKLLKDNGRYSNLKKK